MRFSKLPEVVFQWQFLLPVWQPAKIFKLRHRLRYREADETQHSKHNIQEQHRSHEGWSLQKVQYMSEFEELGLNPRLVSRLTGQEIITPTPIQKQAIPLALSGIDVMGLAQTGTGKTAAFGLPLLHNLLASDERPEPKGVRALVLAPTRELVNQIADNLRIYARKSPVWVSSVVGGQSLSSQIRHLARGTDILVATPGRLLDLADRKAVRLDTARFLVLDEADQMLDLGFIHPLRKIAGMLGPDRQTMLFSATMPKAVEELSKSFLNNPTRVEVSPPGTAVDKIAQSVHYVASKDKTDLLVECLHENPDALSLVFARTKHGAEKLMKYLVDQGFPAASIHGNKSQGQRDRALRAFKKGEVSILVATDVAARGIDIPGVTHVYNYQLPEVPENYVHRIGRTARAGRKGLAVAMCAADEVKMLRAIERLMGIDIPVASGEAPKAVPFVRGGDRAGGRGRKPAGGAGRPKRHRGPKKVRSVQDSDSANAASDVRGDQPPRRDGPKRRNRHGNKPDGAQDRSSGEKPFGKRRSNSGGSVGDQPAAKRNFKGGGKPSGKPSGKPGGKQGAKPGGKPQGSLAKHKSGGKFKSGKPGGGPRKGKPSGGRGRSA